MIQLWWETLFHMSGFPYYTSDYRQWAKILSINCTESTTKTYTGKSNSENFTFRLHSYYLRYIYFNKYDEYIYPYQDLHTAHIYVYRKKCFTLHQMKKKC